METVIDNETGFTETVLKEYKGSKLITQTKRTDKGINCDQWFDFTDKRVKERFKTQ